MDQGTATSGKRRLHFSRHIVERPRLTELLDSSDARIVLLVAPAGYGKTTLMHEWAATRHVAPGWFVASEAATDVAALALGIARAASAVVPAVDSTIRERLVATRETAPDPRILFDLLAAGLDSWPPNAWLVIDDYQMLASARPAEEFIARIVELPAVRLVIGSRQRPAWATARRLLYGEIREIGQTALAMTTEEASAVLEGRSPREVEGLAALAEGWPAVIGLAALSDSELTGLTDGVPETLHEFFAQELFNAVSPELRSGLVQLAAPRSLPPELVQVIGGGQADRLRLEALRHGFLTGGRGTELEMHPLLRQFLLARLDLEDDQTLTILRRLGLALLDAQRWDDVFALAEDFGLSDLVLLLIERAMDELLRAGRLATLRRWVEYARAEEATRPLVDLAEAEIAFREGRYPEAETMAIRAAMEFDDGHHLIARAWYRGAQSAHLDDRVEEALRLHEKATLHAHNARDRQDAIWGQFIAQSELGLVEEAQKTLGKFQSANPSLEDRLRESQARISLGIRWDGLSQRLLRSTDTAHLVETRADPVVRSAYLQMLGCALSLHADYERALDISSQSLAIAEKFRLDFVLPHALYVRATALIGLRQLGEAMTSIRKSAKLAKTLDDHHSLLNSLIVRARVALTKRAPDEALEILNVNRASWPTPALGGEFHAIRSIAAACIGDVGAANGFATAALGLSQQLESEIPTLWARVLMAPRGERLALAIEAFHRTEAAGHTDTVVLAYRSDPALLEELAGATELRSALQEVLEAAHDHALARRLGMSLAFVGSGRSLTPRESEVLDLVRQGLTNAEIARALWISEGTAKVHVRHVLEKLGARSRVEAATIRLPEDS
jgi:LuxR family maltose regulon positive regulatory protein